MMTHRKADKILRLLEEGMAVNRVAFEMNMHRGTIRRVQRREHGIFRQPRPSKEEEDRLELDENGTNNELVYPTYDSVIGYCKACGATVRLPCFACQIKALKRKKERKNIECQTQ